MQIDGSDHDWFEGRGPRCTLLVFVDDATGLLMELRFARTETTFDYFAAAEHYPRRHGKPVAFYSDKASIFRVNRKEAIAWVVNVCSCYLRLSQAKTLAALVASAMQCQRISMANIGRQMQGAAKHLIKRCWRFCDNDRIGTADAMRPIIARMLKKRKKKLLIALDWVDVRGFQTLMGNSPLSRSDSQPRASQT